MRGNGRVDETKTFLAVTDTVSPRTVALVTIAVAIGIGFAARSWKAGAIVAALGVLQWLFVSRTRWLFDKVAGSATLVDETGWKKRVLGNWPLADLSDVISRHRVTEHSDSSSHHYDLVLRDRSGTERPVASFPSPKPARNLAAFLGLPLRETAPLDDTAVFAAIGEALPGVVKSLWREKGLHGLAGNGVAMSFLREHARNHPNDPFALELLGTVLGASGEVSGAVQSLQDAARAYRSRGETAGAERAEQAAARLTS